MARCHVTLEKSSKNYISWFGRKPARGLTKPPPTSQRAVTAHFPGVGRQVRDLHARITRGREGRARWFAKLCHSITDHQSKLKTKIANTILLLCSLYKICLILTGGLWQASAKLFSGGRLYKGARASGQPSVDYTTFYRQHLCEGRKSATATHAEQ